MTLVLRDISGMAEFEAAERLQLTVWGADDRPDPADLMMVIAHEGGLVAGAFEGDDLLGYVFGFPTREPSVQHSHRLAVLPQARGRGLAARLKWYQRDWCLQRGIKVVRWTYDPLRAVNANLNINGLGCTAGTYHVDYYGEMAGINQGAPSDRLLAEWQLDDPAVAARAEKLPVPEFAAKRLVNIPANFGDLLENDREAAVAERLRVRHELTAGFAQGLRVRAFLSGPSAYVLA